MDKLQEFKALRKVLSALPEGQKAVKLVDLMTSTKVFLAAIDHLDSAGVPHDTMLHAVVTITVQLVASKKNIDHLFKGKQHTQNDELETILLKDKIELLCQDYLSDYLERK